MSTTLRKHTIRWIGITVCLLTVFHNLSAQPVSAPQSQELLNGLKVFFWPKPGSTEVLVKLRIHSGSAFDLAGKAGEMALLGDILFPDPETVDFFTEQMGGKLNVSVNYDSMTITMLGKSEQLDNIMEVLRNAILATQLTPDVVSRIRSTRIKIVRDTTISPAMVADRAIAVRLFGDFPYGRPASGYAEDLERVDRADLMLAKERFLNANNATMAIVGGFNQSRINRTLKQLFGAWRKSEQLIPSTFRAAKTPDTRTLLVNIPSPTAEIRLAVRGVSRSDQDFYAALILARVVQNRWAALAPASDTRPTSARSESYMLPGMFVLGTAVSSPQVVESIGNAKKMLESVLSNPVSTAELERAVRESLAEGGSTSPGEIEADSWLDMATYRLPVAQDRATSIRTVSSADLQRVAGRLFKDASIATVVVGDISQLRAALQGNIQFEVLGEIAEPKPSPKPPTKPGATSSPR